MAIRFEATGDFSDLIRENQKFQKQLTALQAALRDVTGAAGPMGKDAVKAYKDIERAAQQAKKSIESPAEAMAATQKKYDAALKAGLLTQEEHAAAMGKLGQKYSEHGGKTESLTGKLLALGAGYMSFQTILGQVQAALAFVNQETERAIGSADKMTDPNKRLRQVATGATAEERAQDLDRMIQRSDQLAAQEGEDRAAVRRVMFSARSEGFEQAMPDIIKYGDVVDIESAATVAGQVPNLFGGKLSPMQAISANLVAASKSRLNFEQLATALPKVSEGAALQGSTPEEAMGVLSVMAGHFASGETAADRFKGLATKLSLNEATKGKGILGGVQAVQAMSEEDRAKFLGDSQELNVAYGLLTQRMPDVQTRIGEVKAEMDAVGAGGETELERQRDATFDTRTKSGRDALALEQRRKALIGEEIANEGQFGVVGAERAAATAEAMAGLKERGVSGVAQYGASKAAQAAGLIGADQRTASWMTRLGAAGVASGFGGLGARDFIASLWPTGGRGGGSGQDPRVVELLERNAQATEDLRDASRTTPRPGASAAAAAGSRQRLGR